MTRSTEISDLGNDARIALRGVKRVLRWAMLVLFAGWLLTGVKMIDGNSVGFVRRFGRVNRGPLGSGLALLLPWPIERLDTVPVKVVRRAEGGFSSQTATIHVNLRTAPDVGVPYCLTGDENIVHVSMVAQYRITNPSQYLYNVLDAEAILIGVLNDAIITCTAQMAVDEVLTAGKDTLLRRTREVAQKILTELGTGIVVSGELQFSTPPSVPKETAAAFQSVVDAKLGMQTARSGATEYATRIKAGAEGRAAMMRSEALAARYAREQQAEGDKKRFTDLLAALKKHEGEGGAARLRVYMWTLYLQTMDEIVGKADKYVLPRGTAVTLPDTTPPAIIRMPR